MRGPWRSASMVVLSFLGNSYLIHHIEQTMGETPYNLTNLAGKRNQASFFHDLAWSRSINNMNSTYDTHKIKKLSGYFATIGKEQKIKRI